VSDQDASQPAALTPLQERISTDLGNEAAARCTRALMDLAALTTDPRQDFIIAAHAIAALTGFAAGSIARFGGPEPERPGAVLCQAVLDYVGQVLLPLAYPSAESIPDENQGASP
jgi:hypothetical protein